MTRNKAAVSHCGMSGCQHGKDCHETGIRELKQMLHGQLPWRAGYTGALIALGRMAAGFEDNSDL